MDQSLRELQRHCDSNPGDLASGERLFNHYLRLGDPVFLDINGFLNGDKDQDFLILYKLFTKLSGDSLWNWLAQFILNKTQSRCQYYQDLTEERLIQFPDSLARERLQQLTKTIRFDFTKDLDSQARFIILYSKFKQANSFNLGLSDIDYSNMAEVFPKTIDQLNITGSLPAIQCFLEIVKNASIRKLKIHWREFVQSTYFNIHSKIRKYVESLTFSGQHGYSDVVLQSILSEPWPQVTELRIMNACLPIDILTKMVDKNVFPQLAQLDLINNDLSDCPRRLRKLPQADKIALESFFFWEDDLTVSQFSKWFKFLDNGHLKRLCCIIDGGGSNDDLKQVLEETAILSGDEIHLEVRNIYGSLDYQWLTQLSSAGLRVLCISLEAKIVVPDKERSQLKALATSLVGSHQFPNLEKCEFGVYQGWGSPRDL